MTWTVVGMLAGVSVLTAPVAHASPRGFNDNHHWYCGNRRRTRPGTACACRRHPSYPSVIALALSPLVRLAINLISLTALLGLVLAPDATADAADYIGAFKSKSDADLIEVGRPVCYDIDKNGQTPNEAADKVLSITDGYVNKIQSTELVAATVVNFRPWDKL
jgi:hypothetical protein